MEDTKKVSETIHEGKTVLSVTPKHEKPWFLVPHLLKLNIFLMAGVLAQVVSGFDGSMMNGLQSVVSWQDYFDHPAGSRLGTMSNGITIGTLIVIPFVTFLCNYLGRRRSIMLGCLIIIIGAVLQGVAQNFSMFMGARILIGVGGCLASTAASPYVTECAYPTHRGTITAMLIASWPLGAFFAALITWGTYQSSLQTSTWSWRIPSILQGFFPLIQLILAFFGPESPRWLVDKGREEEARQFFVKYHAGGNEDEVIVSLQMAEITATIEQEKLQNLSSWLKWIQTPAMRHRLFICFFIPAMLQLEGNALISYYLHIILDNIGITDAVAQLKINLGITVWSLVTSVALASIIDMFKRRKVFLTGLTLLCVVYTIWTILSALAQQSNFKDHGLAIGVVVMIYLYQPCNLPALIGIPYVMEICPYSMRATGSMIYQLSGNIAGLFNNYVNPIAMEAITWKYYIVWCVNLLVLWVIVYFALPETHGKDLEDVGEAFGSDYLTGRAAVEHALADKGEKGFLGVEEDHVERITEKDKTEAL